MSMYDDDNNWGVWLGAIAAGALIVTAIAFGPTYNVWKQGMDGKAELQRAEFTRRVAVLEAQAKQDSASRLAAAEIERARGVAAANKIIGDSLKDNPRYLQYLYITGLQDGAEKGNTTIYVPTEGGMPVPTMSMDKQRS